MAQQMMPEQPSNSVDQSIVVEVDQAVVETADHSPGGPVAPVAGGPVALATRFSDSNTRAVLISQINFMNLREIDKHVLIDHWIPTIAGLERQAARYRFWHNTLVIAA